MVAVPDSSLTLRVNLDHKDLSPDKSRNAPIKPEFWAEGQVLSAPAFSFGRVQEITISIAPASSKFLELEKNQ